jgi:hypothetical protein
MREVGSASRVLPLLGVGEGLGVLFWPLLWPSFALLSQAKEEPKQGPV